MTNLGKVMPSRRGVLQSVVATALMPRSLAQTDVDLIALGREFEMISESVNVLFEQRAYVPDQILEELFSLTTSITETPATSLVGFRIKASVASWWLCGDLQPPPHLTVGAEVMLAIVRNLLARDSA